MLTLGITGGIGSGKTHLCKIFQSFGIPVFYSDIQAKLLYNEPGFLKKIALLFKDPSIIKKNSLNRQKLSAIVFSDKEKLKKLNQLIHPKVEEKFQQFKVQHAQATYIIKEAAILIETGSHQSLDKILLVTAPKVQKIDFLKKRNPFFTKSDITKRMEHQLSDQQKKPFADFIIHNDVNSSKSIIKQVRDIHLTMTNLALKKTKI